MGDGGRAAALSLPYPLRDANKFRDAQLLQSEKLLYSATYVPTQQRVCVKFAAGDVAAGLAVQRAWAAAGLAPEVLDSVQLPGRFTMVTMAFLAPEAGWRSLFDVPASARGAALRCAQQALKRAHALPVTFGTGSESVAAHGDCRSANVMVRRVGQAGEEYEVRFIDFDWAGAAGVQQYPLRMAARRDASAPAGTQLHAVLWPADAKRGGVLQQAHDTELLPADTRSPAVRSRPPRGSPTASLAFRTPRPARSPPTAAPSQPWARQARLLSARISLAPRRTALASLRTALRPRAAAPPPRGGVPVGAVMLARI